MDQRDVRLENSSIAKLIGKVLERGFSLGDDQQTRRVAVQPVNDSRPDTRAAIRKLLKMVCESVSQRS